MLLTVAATAAATAYAFSVIAAQVTAAGMRRQQSCLCVPAAGPDAAAAASFALMKCYCI